MSGAIVQIVSKPGIEYRFSGSVKAREFESVFPLVIDWRRPDAQIAEDFRLRILSLRPARFWKTSKISPTQAAFGNLADKLPFKPLTALSWLGVLRRFEAADRDWRRYFEIYGGGTRENYRRPVSPF